MNAPRDLRSLSIPGGWTERDVSVGDHVFSLLLPASPDDILEQLDDRQTNLPPMYADPYWSQLWQTAPWFGERVLEAGWPAGTRVLELGCGSGVAGLSALAAGCDVTFSDYVPEAVELAQENARRNGFPHAKGLVFDWRSPPGERFEILLGSEVLYDRQWHGPLLDTMARMLGTNGACWFGDPGRSVSGEFLTRATARGWTIHRRDETGDERPTVVAGRRQVLVLRP